MYFVILLYRFTVNISWVYETVKCYQVVICVNSISNRHAADDIMTTIIIILNNGKKIDSNALHQMATRIELPFAGNISNIC